MRVARCTVKNEMANRREFIAFGLGLGLTALSSRKLRAGSDQASPFSPLSTGPATDRFKEAEQRVLSRYHLSARSQFVLIKSAHLPMHVLEVGTGQPVLMLHGGGLFGASWAQLLVPLQKRYRAYAPDLPGCGLTYRIDFHGLPFRATAQNMVNEIMDALRLPKANLIGLSMGGYFALVFALAHPERVNKLVLIGEPAGSSPPNQWKKVVASPEMRMPQHVTLEDTRKAWADTTVAHLERVDPTLIDADNADSNIPGYVDSWNSMLDDLASEKDLGLSYGLRPELKNLRPSTLFIWGDKDFFGPPSEGQEMAALAPHARCEMVSDAGHAVWIDQPERCTKLVTNFLSSES
jgi:pimeloyl-ACP methyl ester carboxylesterase